MIDLSIIIVNWNSADYVLECIRSINAHNYSFDHEIIVVDNASFDRCGEELKSLHPDVIFIQNPENSGFARANNVGAEKAGGAVLLFLNPDTEVLNGAIELMYKSFSTLPKPGVAGCKLLNTDKTLQASCVQPFPTILNQVLDAEAARRLFPKARIWGTNALLNEENEITEVEAVSGACMMIRREVFKEVNGFSPEYFMYAEDIDLCFKTRRNGYRNYYIAAATIVHHGGGSSQQARSNFSNIMMRESISRFLCKSRGRLYSYYYRLFLSAMALFRLMILGALFPVNLGRRKLGMWGGAFKKWFAILRWGLGLDQSMRPYRHTESTAAGILDNKVN